MTVQCDYIVATFPCADPTGLIMQRMLSQLQNGRDMAFRGFTGRQLDGLFFGYRPYDDRIIVQAVGRQSNAGIAAIMEYAANRALSVARFDAQVTFPVDNADNIILFAQPNKRYQAMRISNLRERGETLYVGSATSAYRLRVYNKSAQSGITPDKGEYIRFEITFRNSLADSAYKAYTEGNIEAYFLGYLSKMIDTVTLNTVRYVLDKNMTIRPELFETDNNDSLGRTKMWLEQTVMPCLQKLSARDPEYVRNFIDMLDNIKPDVLE
jgi:hypothetical protein